MISENLDVNANISLTERSSTLIELGNKDLSSRALCGVPFQCKVFPFVLFAIADLFQSVGFFAPGHQNY